MALAVLIGVMGAAVATMIAMPLPYLLGPLLACAGASILGAPVLALPYGRELGQVAVGLAIGLRFIPAVVVATLSMLPFMLGATILMILATMVAALIIRRLAALDLKTAFFATAAAGLAEPKRCRSSSSSLSQLLQVTLPGR
jgi:uncharacterized membrane protein AbrB (regulator of aidB expression)